MPDVPAGPAVLSAVGNNNCCSSDVYVHDLQTGRTELVDLRPAGVQDDRVSGSPSLSADGRFVAFESEASDLVPGDTNHAIDVFVRDRRRGTTTRVSVGADGAQGNGGTVGAPAISADGSVVAFVSEASDLVPGDTNRARDVFVRMLGGP